jgi:hypothetical protein
MKTREEQKTDYFVYQDQYDTLKQHIEWFKTEKGRKSFTRSCMKKCYFKVIREMRFRLTQETHTIPESKNL